MSSEIGPGSVKVCGIRTVEHALIAAEAGADLIGMIFAPARRQVTVERAREIVSAVHNAFPDVRLVGVFVNTSAAEINTVIEGAGIDLVQLHGEEAPEILAAIDRPAVKAFRALPGESATVVRERIDPFLAASVRPIGVLIDGYDPTAHGGTGARADWSLVRELRFSLPLPLGLAGGLTPENIPEAIDMVRPDLVDTSSGVERDGTKDPERIRDFVAGARQSFESISSS